MTNYKYKFATSVPRTYKPKRKKSIGPQQILLPFDPPLTEPEKALIYREPHSKPALRLVKHRQ